MAGTLNAQFMKRFPGAAIHGALEQPLNGHSITVLFGPSGCGKTTVLRCLAGLERPEEGFIRFNDEPWFDADRRVFLGPQERGIGFVFQDYALFPHLNVERNVGYALRNLPTAEHTRRLGEVIERFGLRGLEKQRPRELSGGQQQRVALARALACPPRLLLLDEPLSALDAGVREELRADLRRLLVGCETPVLLVTHDREEAAALGDELIVMHRGRVLQRGPVMTVFNQPADADVAAIVRVETLYPGRIVGSADGLVTVEVGSARLTAISPSIPARDVFVCIRGEDVVLQRGEGAVSSVRNRLQARVISLRAGTPLTHVELDAGFPLFALVTRSAAEELGLAPGESVTAHIKAPAVHLIARPGAE